MSNSRPADQMKNFFAKQTFQQKVTLALAGVLVAATIWGLVYFANRVEYQVLYTELDPQEAQGIVAKLQGSSVPYQLSDDGRIVRVPAERVSELRIQLASDGLPSSGRIGFEIFDQTNFGLTNFQEQVNYQRALEGELSRSIMTLTEVEAARVHLVLPKESLFQTNEEQTKASVILKLRSGRNLSENAVQGIINVVAGSVKGLSTERVTLIDYRGRVLSRPDTEGTLTLQQSDSRQKLENELATKVLQILEPVVGAGRVRPQVSVMMNFQKVEETTETFDPQGSVIRSQQRQEERLPNTPTVGGIPGPRSQPNSAQGAQAGQVTAVEEDRGFSKQSDVINYEISKAVRHTVEPVGAVTRLSVAVVIDNQTKPATDAEGNTQTTSEPRTDQEMQKYRDLIAAAVGYSAERGDQITVENVSFADETSFIGEPTFMEQQAPLILTGLRYLIVPVAFILLYLLFLRPVQKTIIAAWAPAGNMPSSGPHVVRALPPADLSGPQAPMTVRQLEARLNGGGNMMAPVQVQDDYANTPEREMLPLPAPNKVDLIRSRVVEHARQDPETVARLVRIWLNDEKNK